MGRPTSFTPEVRDEIVRNLASGTGIANAAQAAGVGRSTIHNWLSKGEGEQAAGITASDSEWVDFLDRVLRARAKVRLSLAAQIRATSMPRAVPDGHVPGDWRAAAWMLERLDPQNFGRQTAVVQHEHAGHVDISVELLGGRQPVDIPRWKREQIVALLHAPEEPTIEGTVVEVENDAPAGARPSGEL